MQKAGKNKKKKSNKLRIVFLFLFFILFGIVAVVLPVTQTNKLSYGAVPFTPVPAKPNLQLEWFLVPTGSTPPPQSGNTIAQPTLTSSPKTPQPTQPGGHGFIPITQTTPDFPALQTTPIAGVGPTAPKSNGQLCSVGNNSGTPVTGSCYCADLTVTCKNGVGYGANGGIYPGPNPCGTSAAPHNGRFCVEKPVIYLYPTTPTYVDVQVITSGSVVVSDPLYPEGGWKHVFAQPNGNLQYNGKNYSELFYESSVNTFQQPPTGVTIPTNQLASRLGLLLDQLGLVGNEKKEFLTFWLPRLEELNAPYIYFSVLPPAAKAAIDTVAITPKPDTQIAFIAYFKAASKPSDNTLQLPPTPRRIGFTSVEWGGVIGK